MSEQLTFVEYDDNLHRIEVLNLIKILQEYEIRIDADLSQPTNIYCEESLNSFIEESKSNNGKIYVACVLDDVVGFVAFWMAKDPSLYPESYEWLSVEALAVKPAYRRLGIASSLLKLAEEHATKSSVKQLRVNVLAANHLGLSLYNTFGFKNFEVVLRKNL